MRKAYILFFIWAFNGCNFITRAVGNPCNLSAPIKDSVLSLEAGKHYIRINYINPSVFRIRMNDQNAFPEGGKVKFGIVASKYQGHKVKYSYKINYVDSLKGKIRLKIDKKNGIIDLFDSSGKMLGKNDSSPKAGYDTGFELSFKLKDDEKLYGTGDFSRSEIQKRVHTYHMFL